MAVPPAVRSRRNAALTALLVAAFLVRLATVFLLAGDQSGPRAYEHGRIAENLLAGRGFTITFLGVEGPTSQQAPFYPMYLAVLYAFFGIQSATSHLLAQVIQCAAGAATVYATARLAWNLLPSRPLVGWVAGAAIALHPTHIYMVTHLQVVVWATLLLTALLAVVTYPPWQRNVLGAIVGGTLAGWLLLVEPILALALPVVAAVFWLAEGSWRDRFCGMACQRAAVLVAIATVWVAPWLLRNYVVHGEPVFIKSSFGYAFWQGNNPWSHGTDKIPKASADDLRRSHDGTLAGMNSALWEARHETIYIDDLLLKPHGYVEFQGLSEPGRSRILGRRATEFIRQRPGRYAMLCLQRLGFFLLIDQTNPKAQNMVYRTTTILWAVLAGVGLLVSLRDAVRLWPTYAIFLIVTIFHAMVITSVRFRLPIEPLSMIWIGCLAGAVIERFRKPLRTDHQQKRPAEDRISPVGPRGPSRRASQRV